MNIYIPFICLALGTALNWRGLPERLLRLIDWLMNLALVALMAVIGINIGISEEVMGNLGTIGLNCILISLAAIWCSVGLVFLCEKTVMPLERIRLQVQAEQAAKSGEENVCARENECSSQSEKAEGGISPLVFVMPGFIIAGILAGYFLFDKSASQWLDQALTVSLIFLYTGVGVSLASNKSVFGYIRKLGARVLFMPAAIFAGCLIGGLAAGLILKVPLIWSTLSASGMGYYSLTGAYLTETYGITAGTYGFIVNVVRDVLTVMLLPLLIRISKGSPIASGAAGCMDTMLVPVSRFVGPELALVALISGTILTFVVPVWLPVGAALLGSM